MSKNKPIKLSNKEGIHALIMACWEFGVQDVVISPGSRNAPITISFNQSGLFTCHSIADERVAGFYAMGMSLASSRPVAVVCTSGSAALNLAPAIAEAFYQKVPLIAITADRPLAWTDQGNGQTIRQKGVYKNYIRDWYSLYSEPSCRDEIWMNRRRLSECFNKATVSEKGPIHINVPLAEPLYGTKTYPLNVKPSFYKRISAVKLPSEDTIKELSRRANQAKRIMILVGQSIPSSELQNLLVNWSELNNVVVLTETTSNAYVPKAVDTIDRIVMSIKGMSLLKEMLPDVLITCGGYIVSKKIKALLREFQPDEHWHIDDTDESLDTFQSLTQEINCKPEPFLEAVFNEMRESKSDYSEQWAHLKRIGEIAHEEYLQKIPFSDFSAFKNILKSLKPGTVLHMANSTPVRYIQLFGYQKNLNYYGNRGTSGIDGSTSTAAGIAKKQMDKEHLLITGDTAFLYDSNALWNREFPQNLKIVVINNSGGGIFRIIDGPDQIEELEEFFETYHEVDISKLSEAFGFSYYLATNEKNLGQTLKEFDGSRGAAILEIKTKSDLNPEVLKDYFKFIRSRIEKELKQLIKK